MFQLLVMPTQLVVQGIVLPGEVVLVTFAAEVLADPLIELVFVFVGADVVEVGD